MFVGREQQLRELTDRLTSVRESTDAKPGKAVLVRGRRRVGKSRLVEEFVERSGMPYLFYAASRRPLHEELQLFVDEVARSNLPGADTFRDLTVTSWDAALRLLASATSDTGSIVVLDELPYVIAQDPAFEGTLQTVSDRILSRHRLLLIGIGSDLAMMEALSSYDRPFHQRADEMVVPALSPAEVARMLQLEPADAFDAHLVTGGLPLICAEWKPGQSLTDYLRSAFANPTSALLVSAERALAAEFPSEAQARTVLGAIGSGERTFTSIGRASGVTAASLSRALSLLTDKRIVHRATPLSTKASQEARYWVADPYLRFWLEFVGPYIHEVERGRGDRTLERVQRSWTTWRGRAIEPIVREAIDRLGLPLGPDGSAGVVGGYWTRKNDPEIDIVVADRAPTAKALFAVGSIKWLENAPFSRRDYDRLVEHRRQLPGATDETPLLAVSRAPTQIDDVTVLGPAELIAAWPSGDPGV
jgi:AAA+ ATPase superfamily predicted ATPase